MANVSTDKSNRPSRQEIVAAFVQACDGLPRLLTVTEAADVAEKLIDGLRDV